MSVQSTEAVATAASSAAGAAAKVAPPLAISGMSLTGAVPLNDLVLYATLLYTLLQILFLLRDRLKRRRAARGAWR